MAPPCPFPCFQIYLDAGKFSTACRNPGGVTSPHQVPQAPQSLSFTSCPEDLNHAYMTAAIPKRNLLKFEAHKHQNHDFTLKPFPTVAGDEPDPPLSARGKRPQGTVSRIVHPRFMALDFRKVKACGGFGVQVSGFAGGK